MKPHESTHMSLCHTLLLPLARFAQVRDACVATLARTGVCRGPRVAAPTVMLSCANRPQHQIHAYQQAERPNAARTLAFLRRP